MRFINTRIFLFLHAILAFTAFAEARFSHLKRGGPCEVSVKGKTTQLQIPTLIAHKTSNIRSSGAQKEAMIQALAVATGTPIQTICQISQCLGRWDHVTTGAGRDFPQFPTVYIHSSARDRQVNQNSHLNQSLYASCTREYATQSGRTRSVIAI